MLKGSAVKAPDSESPRELTLPRIHRASIEPVELSQKEQRRREKLEQTLMRNSNQSPSGNPLQMLATHSL